jgi:DNA replication protein DnaC
MEPSKKDSPCEDLLPLMRAVLQKANWLTGRETEAEIEAKYARWKDNGSRGREVAESARAAEVAAACNDAILGGMRDALWSYGIDPTGMDEATMRAVGRRARDAAEAEKAESNRIARATGLFQNARCPTRHTINTCDDEDLRTPEWVELYNLLTSQARYANGFLVALLGTRGGGKTHLAVSLIRQCCQELMTCRYVKALDLFRIFRRAYVPTGKGEAGVSEEDIIDQWVSYEVLVVDECHQRSESDYENNSLINLLDHRYDERKCTILIANQSKAEFAAAMGDSVISRIHETGEAFECNWETHRKAGAWRRSDGDELRIPSGVP